jgi:hypothetical protein
LADKKEEGMRHDFAANVRLGIFLPRRDGLNL